MMRPDNHPSSVRLLLERSCLLLSLLVIALLVRGFIFSRFDHNEHMYLAAAEMLRRGRSLYSEFAYLQMPLLPWMYAAASAFWCGDVSWLAIGRWASWLSWLTLASLFAWQSYRNGKAVIVALAAVLVLGSNSTLLRAANESSNYILPVTFFFAGSCFFGSNLRSAPFWAGLFFGLATSTKLFYLAFIPSVGLAFSRERWLPLIMGLLLGLSMPLYYLVSSPDLFLFQNLGFHRLTTAWRAEQGGALGFTFPQRFDMFTRWIFRPDQGFLLCLAVWSLIFTVLKGQDRARWGRLYIFVISVPLAFVSAPIYEQYLSLPVLGSLVMIVAALSSSITRWGLVVVAIAHVAHDRYAILRFRDRTPIRREFQRVCKEISQKVDAKGLTAATLSPLYPLECGIRIYPEFATGPFLYRIMERITPDEPTRNRAVSPRELSQFLDARRPDIIVTGREGLYDRRFDRYAQERRYDLIVSRSRLRVYVRKDLREETSESP